MSLSQDGAAGRVHSSAAGLKQEQRRIAAEAGQGGCGTSLQTAVSDGYLSVGFPSVNFLSTFLYKEDHFWTCHKCLYMPGGNWKSDHDSPQPHVLTRMAAAIAVVYLLLLLPRLLLLLHGTAPVLGFTRGDFLEDFVFGSATSSYQYEGGVDEDGRSPSICDTFAHEGKMPGRSTADVAADGYHKYKDDLKLMVETNLEAYRLSISLLRLIPNGRGAVNPKGLQYYNKIIDELVKNGIQVHIMLYQFDMPQVLRRVRWMVKSENFGGFQSIRRCVLQGVWRQGFTLDYN